VNPWGVSFRQGSPFWISEQGTNATTLYSVNSTGVVSHVFTVNIPTTATGPQGPTAQVSNTNDSSFKLSDGHGARFIFADLNGTISAWNPSLGTNGSTATVEVTTPGAVYTGLAINQADTMLYAANDKAGTIDVFDSNFAPVHLGHHAFRIPGEIAARGLVPSAVVAAAPESQGPETARRLSRTGRDRDRAFQLVGLGIESVDFAVQEAEIAHQKVAAELAEIGRSDSDTPRSGERGVRAAEQPCGSSLPLSVKMATAPSPRPATVCAARPEGA